MRFRLASLLLTALAACGDTRAAEQLVRVDTVAGRIPRTISSNPIDSGRWRVVRAYDIQPPELDSAELMAPQDLAIAADGSVLVADTKPVQIKVFDATGHHLRSIGREGNGPGEFRSAYIAIRGDTLIVQDARNTRATTFDWRTGAMLSERRTACCYYSPIGINGDGQGVVRSIKQPPDTSWRNVQAFVRFPLNGRTADTMFVLERQDVAPPKTWLVREGNLIRMAVLVPLQPRPLHVVNPLGGFITGWSGDYTLRETRDGRDTIALFGRMSTPSAASSAEKKRLVEESIAQWKQGDRSDPPEAVLRAAFDPALIPDTKPAYEAFSVDAAGRRWVRLTQDDTTAVRFDLFDSAGRWLDVVTVAAKDWPRSNWSPVAWGREGAAVMLEGEDGRPLIRVFRIERR